MAITIDNDQQINVVIDGKSGIHSSIIPLNEWTQIRVTFGYYFHGEINEGSTICQVSVGKETQKLASSVITSPITKTIDHDEVRIGGPQSFLGEIALFDIYNPGAYSRVRKDS